MDLTCLAFPSPSDSEWSRGCPKNVLCRISSLLLALTVPSQSRLLLLSLLLLLVPICLLFVAAVAHSQCGCRRAFPFFLSPAVLSVLLPPSLPPLFVLLFSLSSPRVSAAQLSLCGRDTLKWANISIKVSLESHNLLQDAWPDETAGQVREGGCCVE